MELTQKVEDNQKFARSIFIRFALLDVFAIYLTTTFVYDWMYTIFSLLDGYTRFSLAVNDRYVMVREVTICLLVLSIIGCLAVYFKRKFLYSKFLTCIFLFLPVLIFMALALLAMVALVVTGAAH